MCRHPLFALALAVTGVAGCASDRLGLSDHDEDAGADAGDSATSPDPGSCPATEPEIGSPCSGEASCTFGEECCEGACSPSTFCSCSAGRWSCGATDACLGGGLPPIYVPPHPRDGGSIDAANDSGALDGGASIDAAPEASADAGSD